MRNMTFEDFFDNFVWYSGDWDEYCDEAYWADDFSSERAYQWILRLATIQNITLVDKDEVDYDSMLYQFYQDTEKGLS